MLGHDKGTKIMEKLQQQVRQARRRMNIQKFFGHLPWCCFATLIAALVAVLVHKWYPTGAEPWIWNAAWLGGAVVVGIVAAAVWTFARRHEELEAAIEIDRRFGLKERVSSSLALSELERDSEAGQAVVADAVRRIERVDVADRFGVSLGRRFLLPFLPAALAFIFAFALAEREIVTPVAAKTDTNAAEKKQVKRSTDELRKKIEQKKKELAEKGLKDAEDALKEINEGLKDLDKKTDGDRKKSLINLNNMADKLREKREKLSGADDLRDQLNKMKDLEKGPADKLSKAMKDGDFKAAKDEIDKLKEKLNDENLSDEEREKLAGQLAKMKEKMQDVANAHKQAMDDLQQQLNDAKDSGDLEKADKLQQALDKLRQQMPQMDKLSDLANKLGQVSDAMKDGDKQGAQQALSDLQADLDQMQSELDELETLDDALDEIMQAKNAMNCDKCGGAG